MPLEVFDLLFQWATATSVASCDEFADATRGEFCHEIVPLGLALGDSVFAEGGHYARIWHSQQ